MNIQVNGAPQTVPENLSLSALLEQLRLAGKRLAVERNGEIVPRSAYAEIRLQEQDVLEIVQAIGGG